MTQLLKSVLDFPIKLGSFLCPYISNSNNKIENHFHGTVNFIGKPTKLKTERPKTPPLFGR